MLHFSKNLHLGFIVHESKPHPYDATANIWTAHKKSTSFGVNAIGELITSKILRWINSNGMNHVFTCDQFMWSNLIGEYFG